jgi:hypothetical protein
MAERLAGKIAIVTGAGSRGPGVGNGKAAPASCESMVAKRYRGGVDSTSCTTPSASNHGS